MHCPKCDTELAATTIQGIELDRCTGCDGVWFDEKELDNVLQLKSSDIRPLRGGRLREDANRKPGKCPRDGNTLARIRSPRNTDIVVDACPACNGIWLDGGELERLAK